jgi:hypothetical protein
LVVGIGPIGSLVVGAGWSHRLMLGLKSEVVVCVIHNVMVRSRVTADTTHNYIIFNIDGVSLINP